MQSEERDELKQNDLREFLENFGEFWKKSGNTILIIITLVVVVFAGMRIYNTRAEARHENAWADLALTGSPHSFAELAADSPLPQTRAIANLHGADLFLARSLDADDDADTDTDTDEMPVSEMLSRAAAMYQAVLDEDVHEAYKINALLGLGEVALAREDFDAASERFEAVRERAGDAFPLHAGIARQRLADMDRLRQPVALAIDPDPAPGAGPGQLMPEMTPPMTPDAVPPDTTATEGPPAQDAGPADPGDAADTPDAPDEADPGPDTEPGQ